MTTIIDIPRKRSHSSEFRHLNSKRLSNGSSFSRTRNNDSDLPTSKFDFMSDSERETEIELCQKGIYQFTLFSEKECKKIEHNIDEVVNKAKNNGFKKLTVDTTPLRTKYFFGEGYTYGGQMMKPGPNQERLYAKGDVDDIPLWIKEKVISPLIETGYLDAYLPKDKDTFFNSVVINDYATGGCIAPHVDPIHIFCRPLVTISFHSDSFLSFGCRFAYRPLRSSKPLVKLALNRGVVTCLSDYAADNITHCVCPEDVTSRRTVIILRRVCDDAPRLEPSIALTDDISPAKRSQNNGAKTERHSRSRKEYLYDVSRPKRRRRNSRSKSNSTLRDLSKRISKSRSESNSGLRDRRKRTSSRDIRDSLRRKKSKVDDKVSDVSEDEKTIVVKRKKRMFRVKVCKNKKDK